MGETPDQIRGEIDVTRSQLSQNAALLADKVSPGRIASRRVHSVKQAGRGLRERVMGSAQASVSTAVGTVAGAASGTAEGVSSAPDQTRQLTRGNPLAAGLVAFGIGMVIAAAFPASDTEAQAGQQLKDNLAEPVKAVAQQSAQELKEGLTEPTQRAVESVKGSAQDAISATSEQARRTAQDATSSAKDAAATVREQARG